jgi:hypothetical protein
MWRLLYRLLAAGTALTNSTTETVLASHELPALSLQVGKTYRVTGLVRATATNSTDTLNVRIRVGPTTLTGTVCAASGAVDVANDDCVRFDLQFTVRSISAANAAVVIVDGFLSAPGAEGTATARVAFESLSLTSTSAQKIEVTGVWSVASASNSCQAESFTVSEIT